MINFIPTITPEILDSEKFANLTTSQIVRLLTEEMNERLFALYMKDIDISYKNEIHSTFLKVKNKLILDLSSLSKDKFISVLLLLIEESNCNTTNFKIFPVNNTLGYVQTKYCLDFNIYINPVINQTHEQLVITILHELAHLIQFRLSEEVLLNYFGVFDDYSHGELFNAINLFLHKLYHGDATPYENYERSNWSLDV